MSVIGVQVNENNCILKVNYGGLLLQALLEYWPRPYAVEEESDVDAGVSINPKIIETGHLNLRELFP